jgi:hypothetical protein
MSVIINKWNDGSGDSINIESPSFQGNQTVKISSPVQKGTSKRSMKFIGKCKKDSSKQVILTVEQEASTYTYDLTLNSDNTEIAAKGGTANITAVLKTYRNGNLVSTDNVTPVLSGSATGFSISGTTVSASNRTTVVGIERSITVTGKFSGTFDGQEVSATVVVKQEANAVTSITYGTPVVSLSVSDIPASGGSISSGTVTYSQTRVQNYTSGSTSTLTPLTSGGSISYSTAVTAGTLGFTIKSRAKVGTLTATVAMNGKSGSATEDVYQKANIIESVKIYKSAAGSAFEPDFPASGDRHFATCRATYSSGYVGELQDKSKVDWKVSGVGFSWEESASYPWAGVVVTSNRGTTVGSELAGVLTLTVGNLTDSENLTQEANAVVSTVKTVDISLASGAGSSSSNPIPASGGRIQYDATGNTRTTYTSGSYKDEGFTPTISGSAEGFTVDQPSPSAWYITAANRGTVVGDIRSVVVTASATGATSKSVTIYQQANSLTWNNPVITYAYSDIAASGGTVTPSLSITQSGNYTSGSTASNTTIGSKSFSGTGVNTSTGAYSASSLGTTVKVRTKLSTGTVSVTANGKSASKSADIYQAANKIDSYNYSSWNIAVSANPTTIAASGGTSTITASCMRTKTPVYTSGSTGTATTESATPTLAISGTGFTLSGTTVTASKNNVASRTATVTASYSGATSKSVTITQSAGPDGIGYMQIEGNGVDHYIFQVGRTPNTRSNDVQTLSEEPVEVVTETKSESLFAKIKRIVTNLN